MYQIKYGFNEDAFDAKVESSQMYEEEKGYGFLPFSKKAGAADRFTGTAGWNFTEDGRKGIGYPLRFQAAVPHKGTYRIKVALKAGEEAVKDLSLYAGRRNLVEREISLKSGERKVISFFVQVCEYIPVVGEPARLDRSVYVTLVRSNRGQAYERAEAVAETFAEARNDWEALYSILESVEITEEAAPTIYIAGDSLVADYEAMYPYNPILNFGSWGQNMLQYFDRLAVCDQAHGGMTTNCFRLDGHFEIVLKNIRPGDIFMMEFGHNDQKRRNLKAYVEYAANLRWYIGRIREKGAYPVIVTSMSRIPSKDEDGYYDLLEEYAQSCIRVGKECHVPVLDLHSFSFETFCEMGVEVCKDYFMDTTHTNDYGALVMADFLAEEIKKQGIEALVPYMKAEKKAPWKPDVSLRPENSVSSANKEERPVLPHDLPALPYADCQGIRQEEILKEAMWKGLLDPCIRFYHPFEEMPRGQFLYLFFKAVKAPAKRSWQGEYCDIYKYEFDAGNVQAALDGNLIDPVTTPDHRFRPDDALTGGELVSMMIRSLKPLSERALPMDECERQARLLGLVWEGYEKNSPVNRLDTTVALVKLMKLQGSGKR